MSSVIVMRTARLLVSTALGALGAMSIAAHAQTESNRGAGGLEEIVVTAQKREQSLQDVPIAVTAITADSLQANRIANVQDLNGLAPSFTVRPSAGGIGVPTFTMRGATSYGVVPGSDKQVSIYIDGVYIGSSRGSMFDLPDIARIEVLRGPQGTLFGRNATAGAVSIVTREPDGEIGATQQFSLGNYDQFRTRTTIDLPSWGPLSAYASFVYDKRRGDIRNLGAGTFWDRSGPDMRFRASSSPQYMGDKKVENWFAAAKFDSGDFKSVYRYDNSTNHFTAEGTALLTYDATSPLLGSLIKSLLPAGYPMASDAKRPKEVNNNWVVPSYQKTFGHSMTSELRLSDSVQIKNIAAYRKTFVNSSAQIDGLGGLTFTPSALVPYATFAAFSRNPALASAPPATQAAAIQQVAAALAPQIGNRFCVICNHNQQRSKQWSDEIQLNYHSDLLSLTVGGLYFHQKDIAGAPPGSANNFSFSPVSASGRLPLGNWSTTYSKATSLAAYLQAEIHVTPQLDIVGGARITQDKKSGTLVAGGIYTPGLNGFADGTYSGMTDISYKYKKTKPNFSIGMNYKPAPGALIYGKFATAFVSGGSVGSLAFAPETVQSIELGAKADFVDRRLRANVAIYRAEYHHQQNAQSGTNVGHPELSTVIIDAGNRTAKGVELELSAAPVDGLTLNAGLGYTDVKLSDVNPLLIASGGGVFLPTGIPKWTGSLSGQYETPPVIGDARLVFRADATWHSRRRNEENPARVIALPQTAAYASTPASWIVNGRVALRDVAFGPANVEVAAWARNLFNNRELLFPLRLQNVYSGTFVPARTYGVDLTFAF